MMGLSLPVTYKDAFDFLTTPEQKVNLLIPEMHQQLRQLSSAPVKYTSEEYPFVLSAGGEEDFQPHIVRTRLGVKKIKRGPYASIPMMHQI